MSAPKLDSSTSVLFEHGSAVKLSAVPVLTMGVFRKVILESVARERRVLALFGHRRSDRRMQLLVVLSSGKPGGLRLASTLVEGAFPSLTPQCPQLHLFEREIAEQWEVLPEGHPGLKPVRFQDPQDHPGRRKGGGRIRRGGSGVMEFYRVEGEEIHEVAVGPVHAGVIEPGHFRFQCHGERVFHLEIALGFQHRGIESAIVHGPAKRVAYQIETIAGDTTIAHMMAHCQLVETLSGSRPSGRVQAIRAVALELERLANHTGDLGALAGDVGYLPAASYCGRIRGEFLNATALLCGSRFGRGLLKAGGLGFDLDAARCSKLRSLLVAAERDVMDATALLWNTPSVMARFEGTGRLSRETARELGLVGMAARASGLPRDVRSEFPLGAYSDVVVPMSVEGTGDVYARARVRWREIQTSLEFVYGQIDNLPAGELAAATGPLAAASVVVSLVEGWRGEVCHAAITDDDGKVVRYKIVDPSFHNWAGVAMAMRNERISGFPLSNKSFNLSYCGHDL